MASIARIELLSSALTATTNGETKTTEAYQVQLLGYLRVSANDGATTVNAKIQHSADNSNWVDLVSFTAVVNTTSTQVVDITKMLPYVRGVATLAGTPSATVLIAIYFDRLR